MSPWNHVLRSCDPCNVYSSFIMLFCSVYIVWCTVSYLLYLFACMYLCDAIDGPQFKGPQEQGFEDAPEQH
jgi:hypothetical protein